MPRVEVLTKVFGRERDATLTERAVPRRSSTCMTLIGWLSAWGGRL